MNKVEFIIFLVILVVSCFFRFYKLSDSFDFMGDTGRDAREAYKIIIDHRLTLIGPRASVAGFFMGPFYFYLITLPLLIFKMNPIGLAYFASFLGVVAVSLIYLLSRELFSTKISLFITFLYGVSNIVIVYSRMAWNPSPVPIFTILTIYGLIKYLKLKSDKWYLLMWFFAALGGQLHYTFYYLIAALPVVLFLYKHSFKGWVTGLVKGGIILLLINSSLIIFDLRHDFITSNAFVSFISGDKVGIDLSTYLSNYFQNLRQLFDLTFFQGLYPVFKTLSIIGLTVFLITRRKKDFLPVFIGIISISLLFFSAFRETVQLYYFNFLLPVPFLMVGYLFTHVEKIKFGTFFLILIGIFFLNYNFSSNINLPRPYKTLNQIQSITESIVKRVPDGVSFNIASFSSEPWYSAEEYRYYTYYFGKRAKDADNYSNIDKLFVIATGPMENPLAIKSQETVDFGATKIEDKWEIGSIKVFQLAR